MAASLLSDETLTLSNLPHLADITTLANLLAQHGVEIEMNGAPEGRPRGPGALADDQAHHEYNRALRSGAQDARFGPGAGAAPGAHGRGQGLAARRLRHRHRPVDLHLKGLVQLGAEIDLTDGYINATAPAGLKGAQIVFPMVSVGATENLLMAAALAWGETVMKNAAREPEVSDLARCLVAMGAKIEGIGTDTLRPGRGRLHAARHAVVPDRIETGTYAIAAAITGGEVELLGAGSS